MFNKEFYSIRFVQIYALVGSNGFGLGGEMSQQDVEACSSLHPNDIFPTPCNTLLGFIIIVERSFNESFNLYRQSSFSNKLLNRGVHGSI